VIVLSIDTCDLRGSVAVLQDQAILGLSAHETTEEYSSWLLPAVNALLEKAGLRMDDVGGYAAAAGPGSFTGVRVGLTSVKAWAEVYGKPVAGVSRLEAFAAESRRASNCVAAFVDAQRGQVFGGVYRRNGFGWAKVGEEMVIAPAKFVAPLKRSCLERAREARGVGRAGVSNAGRNHRAHGLDTSQGREDERRPGARRKLRAAVRRGDFLERRQSPVPEIQDKC